MLALLVLYDPAFAQRWEESVTQSEEADLTRNLIGALREERWLEAVGIADRYRGSPISAFSQYQAFAYAMTGRLDLIAELQREGRVPSAGLCGDSSGLEHRDAVEAIVEAAAGRRAVIIQEFHWEPRHRLLLHELLPRLREQGFGYFAAEDFEGEPDVYANAGYPRQAPGFHSTREPVFADAVRAAIEQGYRLVPYEASFPPPSNIDPQNLQRYRSDQQAENLYERIFASAPEARAIIYTGPGWAREAPDPDFPGDAPMVARLKELSGMDPLTIDQTMCRQADSAAGNAPAIAFEANGDAAVQGFPAGTFDLQVRYAPASFAEVGRAEWLSPLRRQPVAIPESLRQSDQAVIVEAHLISEPVDASAFDRLHLAADEALPLLLPPGEFRVSAQPDGGSVVVSVE